MIDQLLQFVNDDLLAGGPTVVGADDEIVLDGTLDSLAVARLVGFVEDELGIAISPEEVTIEHFRTLATLVQYLCDRAGTGA